MGFPFGRKTPVGGSFRNPMVTTRRYKPASLADVELARIAYNCDYPKYLAGQTKPAVEFDTEVSVDELSVVDYVGDDSGARWLQAWVWLPVRNRRGVGRRRTRSKALLRHLRRWPTAQPRRAETGGINNASDTAAAVLVKHRDPPVGSSFPPALRRPTYARHQHRSFESFEQIVDAEQALFASSCLDEVAQWLRDHAGQGEVRTLAGHRMGSVRARANNAGNEQHTGKSNVRMVTISPTEPDARN